MRAGTTPMGAKSSKISKVLDDSVPRTQGASISELAAHPQPGTIRNRISARIFAASNSKATLASSKNQHLAASQAEFDIQRPTLRCTG